MISDIDHSTPPLNGDPARLLQIVGNLLSNAIKFTPAGGHVTVRVRVADGCAELTVEDDGLGIRPEFLGQVFDRFNQADQSTSRRYGGLGLGLAIVKHLVELHGGHVAVASEGEQRGATFTVWLPLGTDPAKAANPPRGGLAAGQVMSPPSLDGLTILVVDDERDTLEFVARFLQGTGRRYSAPIPQRRPSRPSILRQWTSSSVTSDCQAPMATGSSRSSATARARPAGRSRQSRSRRIQAKIIVSARSTAGYRAYLAKPVDTTQLLSTVARVAIERQRAAAAIARNRNSGPERRCLRTGEQRGKGLSVVGVGLMPSSGMPNERSCLPIQQLECHREIALNAAFSCLEHAVLAGSHLNHL